MKQPKPDQMTEGGQHYTYRDGRWTTTAGYCVSTTYGHALTLKFYEQHGRSPMTEPTPAAPRGRRGSAVKVKAQTARTAAPRARTTRPRRGRSKAQAVERVLID